MIRYIQVHPLDNVIVAVKPLQCGEKLSLPTGTIELKQNVEAGHKIALKTLSVGESVFKYGFCIGQTKADVEVGEHVHSHNLETKLNGNEKYYYSRRPKLAAQVSDIPTFKGFKRKSGRVGIRNELWVINTVGCVNQSAKRICDLLKKEYVHKADDFLAITHPYGCSQLGDDLVNTRKLLSGLMVNPNAGGILIIGLGCENNQLSTLLADGTGLDKSRIRYFNSQEVDNEIETGVILAKELLDIMSYDNRESVPVSKLALGMKCGGSDGFSGLTANAVVGRVTDMLTQMGGRVILTETPEMFGAEQVLMDRALDEAVFDKIVGLVNGFKRYFIDNNQPVYENPSPGNKAGGLTTLEEKSLGAIQKGGQAIVNEVIDYGEQASDGHGLTLLQAPGNDAVSSTALSAAGANIILFTTGRGTPLGFPVPTIKISSNSSLADRKSHWIDFNAGQILDDNKTIDECADELFDYVLRVASGERTNNEQNDNREIAIWKTGVTL